MEVKIVTKPETSQAELTVTVPTKDVQPYITKAAEKISQDKPLKGFRPGKAPAKVVAEAVGHEHLLQEALEAAIPHFFVEAAVENNVEAINRPQVSITKGSLKDDLVFVATVDVVPEVTLADPSKITAEKRNIAVTDEDIEKELTYLAKKRAQPIEVARPAKEGDVVVVDFEIQLNGQTIEGGSSQNHPVPLGEGHFIPDFEKGLLGIAAGEERTFPVTFPDDYPKGGYGGKTLQAKVKAHQVQQRVVPNIDDDFAKQVGKFSSLQNLKDELKKNMQKEQEEREHERWLGAVAEQLATQSTIPHIPEVLIERDIDSRLNELAQMLTMQQKTMQDYLAQQGKTLEEARQDMRETAEKNVRVGLTLRQLAAEQKIEVSDEEVEQEANAQLQQYKTVHQAEANVDAEKLQEHVAASLRNRKTLEKLAELVQSK